MNAIITGASKGIGKAIASKFAKNGLDLILNARNEIDLKACKADLLKINPDINIHLFAGDLSKENVVKELGKFSINTWKNIDVLVNNAGAFIPGAIHEEEDGVLEKLINTNLYSAYHLSRSIIPNMIHQKSGYIFNMCSIASKVAYPNGGSYSISKFALYGMSKCLREELKPHGIKVTSILPGATWSNSWAGSGVEPERIMEANDIAIAIWQAIQMSNRAVLEEITLRPQLGDL